MTTTSETNGAPELIITDHAHVRTLQLNRPHKKNALSQTLAWDIIRTIDDSAADDDVWVIAITGIDDCFCSGVDLTPVGNASDRGPMSEIQSQIDDLSWVGHFPLAIRQRCDKPVVAGLNGVAAGAGMALAMACDTRLAAESAWLFPGYSRIGGSPDGGLSWTLPQVVGYEKAMRFLLENKRVDADEALALGLIGEVVPDHQFQARFVEYCHSLTTISPIAARLTKRVVREATKIDIESQVRYELQTIGTAFASEDGKESRRAFLERRTPKIQGR
ncbi:MAG TPA: enoyl-CoA hydratase/isomerase family protein [Dehalococcoidia bacterium]|jgi:2-(1,2-epoxy-1,2-dihydrophenyl)acetyl-CoA isomerase|nr:enoyl-CoA hydratase [Chloroflexota bacterium]MDP5876685.1 enoyl-CoA hydratase/isomerase family protein [Dehalococcoidia bacterium]MDP6272432.1 enoyl-CoA hydratase/isomerase family protein [Dehalococcoidia bacterium]MDP7160802.1 enoyl-CoA hydratase/isomerase family protein [Dehalococcoidia bacterium]MDP7213269.1 enoyl-CoA hydratase/isomerase family protein [Dehalococcoidia bacterium]